MTLYEGDEQIKQDDTSQRTLWRGTVETNKELKKPRAWGRDYYTDIRHLITP